MNSGKSKIETIVNVFNVMLQDQKIAYEEQINALQKQLLRFKEQKVTSRLCGTPITIIAIVAHKNSLGVTQHSMQMIFMVQLETAYYA